MVAKFVKLRLLFSIIGLCSVALIFVLNRARMSTPLLYSGDKDQSDYKYILTWTPDTPNVKLMGWSYPDLDGFQTAGCAEHRCHLTNDRSYLGRLKRLTSRIFPPNIKIVQAVPLLTLKSSMQFYSTRETFLWQMSPYLVSPGSTTFTGMWKLRPGCGWTTRTSVISGASSTGAWDTDEMQTSLFLTGL